MGLNQMTLKNLKKFPSSDSMAQWDFEIDGLIYNLFEVILQFKIFIITMIRQIFKIV